MMKQYNKTSTQGLELLMFNNAVYNSSNPNW